MSNFIKQNDVTAHGTDTTTHGVTSDIVGKDDTQTLTNKTISSASNTITVTEANISDLQSYLLNITGESIGNLSDVVLTTPSNTQVLQFNGTNWVNVAASTVGVTDHTALSNIGTNTHAQIDSHIADSTLHFTQASISITESQISDLQSYLLNITGESLSSLSDVTISTIASGELLKWNGSAWINNTLAEADVASAATLSSHTSDSTIHFTQASISITESQISDLQSYLTVETNDLTAAVTWANVPDANITQSSVTQHQAALSITESQISDLQNYQVYSSATVSTTDATPTVLVDIAIGTDIEKVVEISVHGHEDATNDHIWKKMVLGAKNVGGTVSLVGGVDSAVGYDAGASTWDIAASASGSNVRITVTGEAAHSINWRTRYKLD